MQWGKKVLKRKHEEDQNNNKKRTGSDGSYNLTHSLRTTIHRICASYSFEPSVSLPLYTNRISCPKTPPVHSWKGVSYSLTPQFAESSVAIVLKVTSAHKGSGDFCLEPPGTLSSVCHSPHSSSSSCSFLPMVMNGRLHREISVCFLFEVMPLWFSTIDLVLCPLVSAPLQIRAFLYFFTCPISFFPISLHILSINRPCGSVLTQLQRA